MKKLFFGICCILISGTMFCQGKFDRKIIIQDNIFYAVEIVGQTAVLWKGNINKPIDSAQQFAVPAGTKRRSIHFIPFAWDMRNDTMFAINFTEYAQNDRLSSFKSIPIKKLETYNGQNPSKQLMQGAFDNSLIENLPMVTMLKKYQFIDDLFFDVTVTDSTIFQCISVQNELTIWEWKNNVWSQSEVFPFETEGYFSTYVDGKYLYLVNSRGDRFVYHNNLIINASILFPMHSTIMLIDRDTNKVDFINASGFENTAQSMEQVINKYKIRN